MNETILSVMNVVCLVSSSFLVHVVEFVRYPLVENLISKFNLVNSLSIMISS